MERTLRMKTSECDSLNVFDLWAEFIICWLPFENLILWSPWGISWQFDGWVWKIFGCLHHCGLRLLYHRILGCLALTERPQNRRTVPEKIAPYKWLLRIHLHRTPTIPHWTLRMAPCQRAFSWLLVAASDVLRDCTTCNLKGMASLGCWSSWFYSPTTFAQVCCPIGAAVVDPGWCCLLH